MLSILSNASAAALARHLDQAQLRLERHGARLASGLRINAARDDPAGLAIVSRFEARRRSAAVEIRNLNDLGSLVQVADSALASISGNLQRIRELSVQAANETYTAGDRYAMQLEASQLYEQARAIQASTRFNGQALLDGSLHFAAPGSADGAPPALDIAAPFLPKTTNIAFRLAQFTQASALARPTAALQAGDLSLNGLAIPASAAGPQAGQGAASAWAIARAINQLGSPDLVAAAEATVLGGDFVVLPGGGNVNAGQIVINGVPVGAGNLVNAINAIAGLTGVSAALASANSPGPPPQTLNRLTLTASDGRDIAIAGAAAFGLADTQVSAQVRITGPLAENGNLVVAGNAPGKAGLAAGTIGGDAVGEPVRVALTEAEGFDALPDMSSPEGAQATIVSMDRKLDKLVTQRAGLGALARRLEARADNLATTRDAAAAGASRIGDSDYAWETAAWIRERSLQQAGLALSAQANAQPQLVLRLLRGSLNF